MIVRHDRPRYEEKGSYAKNGRKPTVFSEKSRSEQLKGGSKVMVSFRGDKPKQGKLRGGGFGKGGRAKGQRARRSKAQQGKRPGKKACCCDAD